MAEAASTALHVTSQGTLVSASSSLRVRIVAAGGATLHEGLLPGTASACAIQLNDTGTCQAYSPHTIASPRPERPPCAQVSCLRGPTTRAASTSIACAAAAAAAVAAAAAAVAVAAQAAATAACSLWRAAH